MRQFTSIFNLIIPILCAVFYFFICILYPKTQRENFYPTQQESTINIDSQFASLVISGQHNLYSSLLWMHTLLNSDIEHYNKNDFGNWMYLRFLSIAFFDPYFITNYQIGGQYLSIIKDDPKAAKVIYEKGLKYYPDDFFLNLNGAFNDYFELGLANDAVAKYKMALLNPISKTKAPYIPSLLARINADNGNLEDAFNVLSTQYKLTNNDRVKKRYYSFMYSIKAELDLACLNQKLKKCNLNDLDGNSYLFSNGKFKARKEWKPFRIKKRRE